MIISIIGRLYCGRLASKSPVDIGSYRILSKVDLENLLNIISRVPNLLNAFLRGFCLHS